MVNTMESEVYEGDVYNSLTASIFELGNGSEFIFFGIWLGKPFWRSMLQWDSMAWRGRLGHQFSTVIMDMVGLPFKKNTVVAINWQFEEGYMKEMKVTARPQTFGNNGYSLSKLPHGQVNVELITHLPHPFLWLTNDVSQPNYHRFPNIWNVCCCFCRGIRLQKLHWFSPMFALEKVWSELQAPLLNYLRKLLGVFSPKEKPKKTGKKSPFRGHTGVWQGRVPMKNAMEKNKWGRLNYTSPNFREADKMMGRLGSLCFYPHF